MKSVGKVTNLIIYVVTSNWQQNQYLCRHWLDQGPCAVCVVTEQLSQWQKKKLPWLFIYLDVTGVRTYSNFAPRKNNRDAAAVKVDSSCHIRLCISSSPLSHSSLLRCQFIRTDLLEGGSWLLTELYFMVFVYRNHWWSCRQRKGLVSSSLCCQNDRGSIFQEG